MLLQDPLYEPMSHSFLPHRLNGFFLLANFGLPMLLGFFSYWALSKNEPQELLYVIIQVNYTMFIFQGFVVGFESLKDIDKYMNDLFYLC